jgi:predicted ATP-binding protein involved in virulence
MRIDRLKIQNFNGFESCEITFNPHFNLLVGDNASGKSTVLDALAILLDSWVLGIKGDENSGGILQDQVRLATHAFQDSFTFEKQFPARLEASGVILERSVTWARELARENGRTTYVEAKAVSSAANEAAIRVRAGSLVALPLICSYGTERLWYESRHYKKTRNKEEKKGQPSRFDGYEDCNEFEIQETALLDWIRAQYLDGLSLERSKTIAFKSIEHAVIECVEGATSLSYSERYKDAVVGIKPEGPQFFKNLSDGQRIMLTLIGDLVRRATTLNPHLGDEVLQKTSGVVLIDELDLHLHPIWQRRVIHDLKRTFPAVQFITTTHSPQLIGEAQPNEIRVLAEGRASIPPRSFGLDSSRVLEEVQGSVQRDPGVESLISQISEAIDAEKFDEAKRLLPDLESKLGPDDAEVTRARSLMKFLESPV